MYLTISLTESAARALRHLSAETPASSEILSVAHALGVTLEPMHPGHRVAVSVSSDVRTADGEAYAGPTWFRQARTGMAVEGGTAEHYDALCFRRVSANSTGFGQPCEPGVYAPEIEAPAKRKRSNKNVAPGAKATSTRKAKGAHAETPTISARRQVGRKQSEVPKQIPKAKEPATKRRRSNKDAALAFKASLRGLASHVFTNTM